MDSYDPGGDRHDNMKMMMIYQERYILHLIQQMYTIR
jgi:hypothetical protein